ncbi:hypothetical protein Tco_0357219 [Tanacetum coccineum]
MTIFKQQHDLDTVSYHKLFDVLKQYQKEVNEIHAERIAKNANPLALVAVASPYPDPYYQAPKSHKPYAPTSKQISSTRSSASTKFKGKEIAKPITLPSESASEEDSDPEQAQGDKDSGTNYKVLQKDLQTYQQQPQIRTFFNSENKNRDTSLLPRETIGSQETKKGERLHVSQGKDVVRNKQRKVSIQAEHLDLLETTDEEIDGTRIRSTLTDL